MIDQLPSLAPDRSHRLLTHIGLHDKQILTLPIAHAPSRGHTLVVALSNFSRVSLYGAPYRIQYLGLFPNDFTPDFISDSGAPMSEETVQKIMSAYSNEFFHFSV